MTKVALALTADATLDVIVSTAVKTVPADAGKVTSVDYQPKYAGMSWRKDLVQAIAKPLGCAVYFKGESYFLVGRQANVDLLEQAFHAAQLDIVKASAAAHKADKDLKRVPFEREETARRLARLKVAEAKPAIDEAVAYAVANVEAAKPKEPKAEKPAKEKAEKPAKATKATEKATAAPVASTTGKTPFKKKPYAGKE